jgi:hypothetical protein
MIFMTARILARGLALAAVIEYESFSLMLNLVKQGKFIRAWPARFSLQAGSTIALTSFGETDP